MSTFIGYCSATKLAKRKSPLIGLRGAIHIHHCTLSSESLFGGGGGGGVSVAAAKKTMLGK